MERGTGFKFFSKFLFSIVILMCFESTLYSKHYDITQGNKISILKDIVETNNTKFNLFDMAKDHIHIVTYYWDSSTTSIQFINSLRNSLERGVAVRVVTNCHVTFIRDFLSKVKRSLSLPIINGDKIDFVCFNPHNSNNVFANNIHDKFIIIDGKLAVFGSRNFSEDSFDHRDFDFLAQGPIVTNFQEHFVETYKFVQSHNFEKCLNKSKSKNNELYHKEKCIRRFPNINYTFDEKYFPHNEPLENGFTARLITNDVVSKQFQFGFNQKERLEYFSNRDDIINTIINSDFQNLKFYSIQLLMTPVFKNFLLTLLAENKKLEIITNSIESSSYYSEAGYFISHDNLKNLVLNDAQVHLWKPSDSLKYVHAKVMIMDDNKAFIGSHNFNLASSIVANELMLEVQSEEFVKKLNKYFESDKNNFTYRATPDLLEKEKEEIKSSFKTGLFNIFKNFIVEHY